MISALLDNYIYQHQADGFGLKRIIWRRVLDVNDRSPAQHCYRTWTTYQRGYPGVRFRHYTCIGDYGNFCLAKDTEDLRRRIENIILGFDYEGKPFTVKDLGGRAPSPYC